MKYVSHVLIILCSCLTLAGPLRAQISFFQPPTFTDCLPSYYGSLYLADFNGDGKPDLLCVNGTLSLGNGDGTFRAGTQVPITLSQTGIMAVADFNGDGRPDVLEPGASATLLVLPGNGDGTFGSAISSSVGEPLAPVVAGDLNGDGRADVVGIYSGSLYVCIGNGDGTFKAGVPYGPLAIVGGTNPDVMIDDFNGDGKLDVAVNTGAQVVVFLGNGDGTLQSPKTSAGPYSLGTVAGDFNGDGKLDLAIGSGGQVGPLSILLGNGDGTFQTPKTAISNTEGAFAAVDLNGDGKLDLVATDDTIAQVWETEMVLFPQAATTLQPRSR